jgi:hypothetical protein
MNVNILFSFWKCLRPFHNKLTNGIEFLIPHQHFTAFHLKHLGIYFNKVLNIQKPKLYI